MIQETLRIRLSLSLLPSGNYRPRRGNLDAPEMSEIGRRVLGRAPKKKCARISEFRSVKNNQTEKGEFRAPHSISSNFHSFSAVALILQFFEFHLTFCERGRVVSNSIEFPPQNNILAFLRAPISTL